MVLIPAVRLRAIQPNDGEDGRSDRIRTSDFLLPKQALYQAELRSDGGRLLQGFANTGNGNVPPLT